MKILLTGEPKSGKTTLLHSFLEQAPGNKQGFQTYEMKEGDRRTGFELVSSTGDRDLLARPDSQSLVRVGRFGVEVKALNAFMGRLGVPQAGSLLYIDEIGQMQLFSELFKGLVVSYLEAPNMYVGTISSVYSDTFVQSIKNRPDILLLTITSDNREVIRTALSGLAYNLKALESLPLHVQQKVLSRAQQYVAAAQFVQLAKLFKNALRYVAEHRVKQLDATRYLVAGNHGDHEVVSAGVSWRCDCDLSNGRGSYQGRAGECSHIQSVLLSESA